MFSIMRGPCGSGPLLDGKCVPDPLKHAGRSPGRASLLLPAPSCWARGHQEVLAGAIGCFWRLAGNEPVVFGSPEKFLTFNEPGFAKAVVAFRLDPRGAQTLLTTETRFVATDEATHRLMSRYWRIIRPWSNLIRTQWLRAIRRRAVRCPTATPEST